MEPPNRMFYWTFCSVSNRYREPSKRILLAVILEKVQHFSWKVQHAFVIAKRSPLYCMYIHALSVHTKSLFLRHFTRIGWDEGGGAVQCSPPPLRPQQPPPRGVSVSPPPLASRGAPRPAAWASAPCLPSLQPAASAVVDLDEGPLLWQQQPDGWLLATQAQSPTRDAVDSQLQDQGLTRSELEGEGDPLNVWTRVVRARAGSDCVKGRTGVRRQT